VDNSGERGMVSLADFIAEQMQEILEDWEIFAKRTDISGRMSPVDLRNDAQKMLQQIAADMRTAQSSTQQQLKSEGLAPRSAEQSSAEQHGLQRFEHGFDMDAMVSEYRALRATVIRRWAAASCIPMELAMQELVRFNEGLDQAIAESIGQFTRRVDEARDLFLATLGHDVRTPLNAIIFAAEAMARDPTSPEKWKGQAARIARNADLIGRMANDLLDLTRTRMGGTIPLDCARTDLAQLATNVVDDVRPAYAGCRVECTVEGDAAVQGDAGRLGQVIMNLVSNSLEHGDGRQPVQIAIRGDPDDVCLNVHNSGKAIAPEALEHLFEPWHRSGDTTRRSVGLGLYIVAQIVAAHDGTIRVESSESGTTVSVTLPRNGPTHDGARI